MKGVTDLAMTGIEGIINAVRIEDELINRVIDNCKNNDVIIDYYERLINELHNDVLSDTLKDKRKSMIDCNKFWIMDKYEIQKVLDYKKTFLCHDKFCSNCKKVRQASRMARFIPYIKPYKDDLYHLVLTVPNVYGKDLKDTIKKVFKSFYEFIEYLKGHKKIKDISFDLWGYKGCIRSLEVTYKGIWYHPHLHVGMVLKGFCESEKSIINKYSYNYGTLKRLFSDQEILIQKIWYLLMNDIEVNKKNIDSLKLGYSCTLDKFNDEDFAELFKYMTKEYDKKGRIMSYENFKVLYESLYNVRQIQGYGCFFRIKDIDISEEVDEVYNIIIEHLQKKENPVSSEYEPKDLLLMTDYKKISRKRIFEYLREIMNKSS